MLLTMLLSVAYLFAKIYYELQIDDVGTLNRQLGARGVVNTEYGVRVEGYIVCNF